jgi:hypothetical protein
VPDRARSQEDEQGGGAAPVAPPRATGQPCCHPDKCHPAPPWSCIPPSARTGTHHRAIHHTPSCLTRAPPPPRPQPIRARACARVCARRARNHRHLVPPRAAAWRDRAQAGREGEEPGLVLQAGEGRSVSPNPFPPGLRSHALFQLLGALCCLDPTLRPTPHHTTPPHPTPSHPTPPHQSLLDRICEAYYLPNWCSIADYRRLFGGPPGSHCAPRSEHAAPPRAGRAVPLPRRYGAS